MGEIVVLHPRVVTLVDTANREDAPTDAARLLSLARFLRREREALGDFLPAIDAGDSQLDLLIDLQIAMLEGRSLTMAELAGDERRPETSALRALALLEQRGMVRRGPRRGDRVEIALTASAAAGLAQYLRAMDRRFPSGG